MENTDPVTTADFEALLDENRDHMQVAFNRVCETFAKQGEPSHSAYSPLSVGALRSNTGCRCAVGTLIPDHQYSYALEGGEPISWVEHVPALAALSPMFLQSLLNAHDDTLIDPTPARIQGTLRDVARKFGLDDSAVGRIMKWG